MKNKKTYDALVVGSGPNGLAAAITLAEQGFKVKILESSATIGGGTRTEALLEPGYYHDVCSAIHPLAFLSPFMKGLNWDKMGVKWANPTIAYAQPLDGQIGAAAYPSLDKTLDALPKIDQRAWSEIFQPLVKNSDNLFTELLGPLSFPKKPISLIKFGLKGIQPASYFARDTFKSDEVKALFAGIAAHSMLPLTNIGTSAIGLVLGTAAHKVGWPLPIGGSHRLTQAMATYFISMGGEIVVESKLNDLEKAQEEATVLMLDIGPKQFSELAKNQLSNFYLKRLDKFNYGMGVYKLDIIMDKAAEWTYLPAREAGTVHLGGALEAIEKSEQQSAEGTLPDDPYVLVAQQSIFDDSRTPNSDHILWAYMHVPHNFNGDASALILNQIERFAPGFKSTIKNIHQMHAKDFEKYNPNYVGGDINGGKQDITQLFTRPITQINPYKTPLEGVFLCSSSTPPGGGVHGMCGFHAAKSAIKYLQKQN
jgi:phytoene dehydrogenase-like protein